MLAPMQGVTNRALREVFGTTVRPDLLFTEFVRVRAGAKTLIAGSDFVEALHDVPGVPLVVQVIGSPTDVVQATTELVERGVQHINVNMGCPFGRMTSVLAGGGMFRDPSSVQPMLSALRKIVPGSLSVKTRLGIDDDRALLRILPSFEASGVDFIVVHARTVAQKYRGDANHDRTAEIVQATSMPVVANGDIRDATQAAEVLSQTGACGLMLGRGALADPWLFERIRGHAPPRPLGRARQQELAAHLTLLVAAYQGVFHGDAQILSKLKETLVHIDEPDLARWIKRLKKQKKVAALNRLLAEAETEIDALARKAGETVPRP